MTQFWNYEKDGRDLGPFSPNEIKKLANSGVISPETLVWQDGTSRRVPAILVRGLIVPKVAIDVSETQRDASSLSAGQGQISENKNDVKSGEIQQTDKFTISNVPSVLQGMNRHVLKRVHPQRYFIILLAIVGLSAAVINPIIFGKTLAVTSSYQLLTFFSLLPTIAVFFGNPREPMSAGISTFLIKFEGFFAILWGILILLSIVATSLSNPIKWFTEKVGHLLQVVQGWFGGDAEQLQSSNGSSDYIPYIMLLVCTSIVLLVIFGELLGSKNNSQA